MWFEAVGPWVYRDLYLPIFFEDTADDRAYKLILGREVICQIACAGSARLQPCAYHCVKTGKVSSSSAFSRIWAWVSFPRGEMTLLGISHTCNLIGLDDGSTTVILSRK